MEHFIDALREFIEQSGEQAPSSHAATLKMANQLMERWARDCNGATTKKVPPRPTKSGSTPPRTAAPAPATTIPTEPAPVDPYAAYQGTGKSAATTEPPPTEKATLPVDGSGAAKPYVPKPKPKVDPYELE
jgi:hypothetical protein